jgi:hypothetical protein
VQKAVLDRPPTGLRLRGEIIINHVLVYRRWNIHRKKITILLFNCQPSFEEIIPREFRIISTLLLQKYLVGVMSSAGNNTIKFKNSFS